MANPEMFYRPGTKIYNEYDEKYGSLPNSSQELVNLISTSYGLDDESVDKKYSKLHNAPWKEISFDFLLIPKPTPRPRWSPVTNQVYVSGADENKKLFSDLIKKELCEIIATRCEYELFVFEPTPISVMTKEEILAAEKGYIRPLHSADWDNLGKAYCDMLQDNLLTNDCIITRGTSEKFYSIKPRISIRLRWQIGFDSEFNRQRALKSKHFNSLFPHGIDEVEFE